MSQNAGPLNNKDLENVDASLNSQRKKSPFSKDHKREENNESLPNLRQSSQSNPSTSIQNTFASIQSKRSGTRNKALISTNSNHVYYNQNDKDMAGGVHNQKTHSRNRALASFYNSEKINPD